MNTLVERDFTISPTFAVKEATPDVMAAARRKWHDAYTMPWQWKFYTISRKSHGSFFFDWTSEDEAAGIRMGKPDIGHARITDLLFVEIP